MGIDDGKLSKVLSGFSCVQDIDIELFLRKKAIEFEKLSKAKTYLIFDENAMYEGRFIILGYISVSLKVLILPDTMSIRQRKDIDGYHGKIHGMPIREIPCYLIGQLAKNSNIKNNALNGSNLIDFASAVIENAVDAVGGRYMMIECHDNQNLINFYKSNGFKPIFNKPLDNIPMIQMIRAI
jgi:hypothetical protein